MLVLATTVLVEFHEVVFNPQDLGVIGPRPVSPRTYTAARFGNLLFYVGMIFAALNLFPIIVGAGLNDVSFWYVPAFLTATVCGSLTAVCLVVLVLAAVGRSEKLEGWKAVLAWTQIAVFAVAAYGGQLMFRNQGHATEVWLAFPPEWAQWLPSALLARFVDAACESPSLKLLGIGAGMLAFHRRAVWRDGLSSLAALPHHAADPVVHARASYARGRYRIARIQHAWQSTACPREARVGFWLTINAMLDNAAHRMRCLYPLNVAVAVVLVGFLSGQFENPLATKDASLIALPILSVYLLVLAVPVIVLNLTFSEWHESSWILRSAPLANPYGIAKGSVIVVQLLLVTPASLLLGSQHGPCLGRPRVGRAACRSGLDRIVAGRSGRLVVCRSGSATQPAGHARRQHWHRRCSSDRDLVRRVLRGRMCTFCLPVQWFSGEPSSSHVSSISYFVSHKARKRINRLCAGAG